MDLGPAELIIILLIVLLLFGPGRIAHLGGELGTALREFREGLQGGATDAQEQAPEEGEHEDAQEVDEPLLPSDNKR